MTQQSIPLFELFFRINGEDVRALGWNVHFTRDDLTHHADGHYSFVVEGVALPDGRAHGTEVFREEE